MELHNQKELLIIEYLSCKKTENKNLKEKIVVSYTPLVEYIARKLAFQREDIPDLVQVGTIGLLKSLDNFNPKKAIAFSTFASSNIIGEIKHYLRDKSRMLKLPRKLQEQYSKIRQFIKKETQECGRFPTVQEIAAALDLTEEDILEALEAGQTTQVISLDKPLYKTDLKGETEERISLLDSLGMEFKDDWLLNKEILKQAIQKLPERGKKIIYLRFYEGLTQKEIALRLNLSQMHISRLLNECIDKLKHSLMA